MLNMKDGMVKVNIRKRIPLGKGITANIGKKSLSISLGGVIGGLLGASVNIGKQGVRITGSLRGTGASIQHTFKGKK